VHGRHHFSAGIEGSLSASRIESLEGNGEFIAYRDAELTAQYNYDVSYMYRGLYGSTASAHDTDSKFVRVDTSVVLKYPFQTKDVGKTVYIKATSFNAFGVGEQDLAEVEGMEFTIVGYNKKTILVSGTATIQKDVPTTITYSQTFSTAPYPQVTITDTQVGDLVQITNMTKTSFDCYFENDDETIEATTRTINYLVSGQ
jgi:hypothetical protein